MNRKQRLYTDINRLMGHGPRRWRAISMASRLTHGMHLDDNPGGGGGGGTKLVTLEYGGRSFNLNEAIKIENPERDVPGYLEAIRYQACQIFEKHGPNSPEWKEALGKVTADVQKVIDGYEATLKDYREHLRKIPEPEDRKLDTRPFTSVELRFDPAGEAKARRDREAGPGNAYLERMSLAQFNLTCRRAEQLGLDDEKAIKKVQRFQQIHDVLSLMVTYLAKKDSFFHQRGGWEALPLSAEFKVLALELGQAVHSTRLGNAINETNADEGKNWVPGPILSGRIFPKIEEELRLMAQFETIPMAAKTQDSAVLGAHKIAYKLLENIADDGSTSGAKIKASLWVTKKFTLDAKLYAAGCVATPNWMQDSIAGAEEILSDLAFAMGLGLEQWGMNGQLSAALDTVSIAADDIRKMGDGLRYWYSVMKGVNAMTDIDFGAGITADGVVKTFGQQGSYGTRERRSIFVANTYAIAQLLVMKNNTGRDAVLTMAQLGPNATIRTGSLGQMFGRDIIPSGVITQTHDAFGIDTGAGTKSILLHVFTEGFKRGQRLGMQIDMSSDYRFFEYQEAFRAVARDDFAPVYDPAVAGNTSISQGVNIAKA